MKTPNEHYVTARNVIDQYEYSDLEESNLALAELKEKYPDAEIIKNDFHNLRKYWISVVIPLDKAGKVQYTLV
jgi:hypothetical protein